jgi:hypothetical protein
VFSNNIYDYAARQSLYNYVPRLNHTAWERQPLYAQRPRKAAAAGNEIPNITKYLPTFAADYLLNLITQYYLFDDLRHNYFPYQLRHF